MLTNCHNTPLILVHGCMSCYLKYNALTFLGKWPAAVLKGFLHYRQFCYVRELQVIRAILRRGRTALVFCFAKNNILSNDVLIDQSDCSTVECNSIFVQIWQKLCRSSFSGDIRHYFPLLILPLRAMNRIECSWD